VVRHAGISRWIVGEPDNRLSPRVERTVDVLQSAGIDAEVSTDIRSEVFAKLLRNAATNTVAALTGLPVEWLSVDPSLRALVHSIVDETAAVAASLGFDMRAAADAARQLKPMSPGLDFAQGQKPSMLQDVIARRPMEVDALLGQLCLFADGKGIACPTIRTVLALLRGLDTRLKMPT
jgi:2-dehydropantoate 2-reductase